MAQVLQVRATDAQGDRRLRPLRAPILRGLPRREENMKFPATESELTAGGWRVVGSRPCRLCKMPLDFFRTLTGKMMPCEMILDGNVRKYVSHFATCPHADKFRKPKQNQKLAPTAQKGLFQ